MSQCPCSLLCKCLGTARSPSLLLCLQCAFIPLCLFPFPIREVVSWKRLKVRVGQWDEERDTTCLGKRWEGRRYGIGKAMLGKEGGLEVRRAQGKGEKGDGGREKENMRNEILRETKSQTNLSTLSCERRIPMGTTYLTLVT